MSAEYRQALNEVLKVLEFIEEDLYNKIPKEIITFYEANKSLTYEPDITFCEDVNNLNISQKAKEILAGLYLDYMADDEEKQEMWYRIDENRKKVNGVGTVGNESIKFNKNIYCETVNNKLVMGKKESFFSKLINSIKNIFKKEKCTSAN